MQPKPDLKPEVKAPPKVFVSEASKTKFIDTKTAAESILKETGGTMSVCKKGTGYKIEVNVGNKN